MTGDTVTSQLYKNKIYGNNGNQDVLDQISVNDETILDVGCGAGDNARILKMKNKDVTCVTVSVDEAELVRKVCDKVLTVNIENEDLIFEHKFDAIILSHVCEHLVHPGETILRLTKYLNKNGKIIIAIPNIAFFKNRFKLLKGDWTMHESGPFDKTHLHFYSYYSANTIIDENKVTMVTKIAGQLAVPLWPLRILMPSFSRKIDKTIGSYFPNLFAQQIVMVITANK
jgi:2-polyprenyl-3-methyl-5-hydroxy-6-metoxy-1,4-benzoquinol methylase